MNRRGFLHTAAGALSVCAFPQIVRSAGRTKAEKKPNLIVFLPDQQRADTIVPYGSGRCHAPNLNKLASQSTVFDRCYVTQPVCTPSRASLLTGTWPHTNGCTHNDMALAPQWKTLPEMLGDADYRTAYLGKWHLGDEVFAQRGFQEWVSIEDMYQDAFSPGRDRTAVSDYARFLTSRGHQPDGDGGAFSRQYASTLPIELSKTVFLEHHACDYLTRHRHEPFVLFISFLEPHSPYNGPLNAEHTPEEVELEPTANSTFGANIPLRYRLRQEGGSRSAGLPYEEIRAAKQRYLGLVTQIDRSIGAILRKLEELALADNTIVVHTSDHGDMMGAHRLFGKEVMFEPAARVPYLVRLPSQTRQQRIAQPVSHIDFAPTMLDLLGGAPHGQCAGRSRVPLLRGEQMAAESVFLQWAPNGQAREKFKPDTSLGTRSQIDRAINESTRAVVTPEGWKLCLRDSDKNELYNLRDDPFESENLFGHSAHGGTQKALATQIRRWQQRFSDKVVVT